MGFLGGFLDRFKKGLQKTREAFSAPLRKLFSVFRNLDEVRVVVAEFVESYNQHWRLEKLGYLSPVMARLAHVEGVAA